MANNRKPSGRKEPPPLSRAGGQATLDLRLDSEDRVSRQHGSRPQGKPAPGKDRPGTVRQVTKAKARRKGGNGRGRKPRRTGWRRLAGRAAYWSLVLGIWGGIALACVIGWYAAQLPQMSTWNVPQRPPNARIMSVDGALIANRGATGGEAMRLEEMSPYIPMAVIAIEDRRFKYHFGIDPLGLTRAMITNVVAGEVVQGGSTLTQQLAKNLFLEPDRTIGRKVQEAVLALWLETKFTKDEILELYLNRVYFGSGAYGVDAASRRYFGKSARDVTLAEAALLAGLLKAPSRLSPARDTEAANERAQIVLAAMQRGYFITQGEADRAKAMDAATARHFWSGSEHYAADMVMDELKSLIGEVNRNIIVDTTIDFELQREAGKVIAQAVSENASAHQVSQGALVSLDGTGAIRAIVGGADYSKSQYNRASDAKRQPGSAFKPIVYLAALEGGRTPDSVRQDTPVRIGKWTPANYDKEYRGPVTLQEGLTLSLNTIAAQLVMEVGPKTVIETAHRLGIESELERNASIALGTSEVSLLELTTAYAPFSNGGYGVQPWLIRRVMTADGDVLYERPTAHSPQVVGTRELGMMNAMLNNVMRNGTGKAARISGWETAGKTGTTQNSRDALFVGYTANLVAGIWFGNDDGTPMNKVTGGTLPARSWAQYMSFAHNGVPVAALPGNWQPQLAVVPRPAPVRPANGVQRPVASQQELIASDRGEGGPRPQAGVGEGAPRERRSLFNILFGGSNPG